MIADTPASVMSSDPTRAAADMAIPLGSRSFARYHAVTAAPAVSRIGHSIARSHTLWRGRGG